LTVAHLGADVAAFVDGQLSGPDMEAARRHLDECQRCRTAVQQQVTLKNRMRGVPEPSLPPGLFACLSQLPDASITHESFWSRLRRSRPARIGVAIVGASLAVVVVAYSIGGVRETVGDRVAPAADKYTADFTSSSATQASATDGHAVMSPAMMSRLDAAGWPCHETLAGGMHRVRAVMLEHGQVVSLTYADSTHRLDLFEQNGALDAGALHGFDKRTVSDAKVWVRDGIPTVVTWDHDGVVYTLVTDAGQDRIERALTELPTPPPEHSPAQRIGDGLDRMATWITPAA
jgi:anti-sigma factor RsiW